jgi:hypothetical protein
MLAQVHARSAGPIERSTHRESETDWRTNAVKELGFVNGEFHGVLLARNIDPLFGGEDIPLHLLVAIRHGCIENYTVPKISSYVRSIPAHGA